MKNQKSSECGTGICNLADDECLRSLKATRQIREFLAAQRLPSASPLHISARAEEYLKKVLSTNSLQSLPFELVLKLLFVSGGELKFSGNGDYRQCPLTGGANFELKGKQLLTADFNQILTIVRNLIDRERSTDCTAVRKDHFCKPMFQLAHLKEIELARKYDANLTFAAVREKMSMLCYDMSVVLRHSKANNSEVPATALSKLAV